MQPEPRTRGYLIISKHRKPLNSNNIAVPWKKLMKRAGMLDENGGNKYTPYDFRRLGISWNIRTRELSLREVMRLAGHGKSSTTLDLYGRCFANDTQAANAARVIEGEATELGVPNPCQRLLTR